MTERDIFLALLDLPDPADRTEYLDKVCGGDAAQRARVESLLQSHDTAGSFLGSPAVKPSTPDVSATQELDREAIAEGSNEPDHSLTFLTPASRPDSLGRIGHYEVLEVLGRGGFGIVFRAFDETLQRVVALKVLAPHLAATSPARKRFLREARSSAKVRHENVVQVYAVEEDPLPYLVMEFVPGETLQQRLDRIGPLDATEVVQIGRQIADGLAVAHGTGLIHRDIKPGNILIEGSPHQRVKITDFGLARAADDASMTQSGMVAGTPMFMAPEQAQGDALDHRADLFSLGSVLYTMCAGRPPFRANSTLAVLRRVAEDTPRPIREIIPEVPQWLCDVISRLHAKKPEDRIGTAHEVAELLRSGPTGIADCKLQIADLKAGKPSLAPSANGAPKSGVRRRWAVAAAVLLMVVGGLAITEATGVTDFRSKITRLFSPERARVVEVKPPPAVPPTWEQTVAAMPAEEQVKAVVARLKELNPSFDGKVTPTIEDGVVTGLQFLTDEVDNIAPVRALKGLTSLNCRGTYPSKGKLSDLSPLKGMSLYRLEFSDTQVADLIPLRGMPLTNLDCSGTPVSDLTPLKEMALVELGCATTKVSDLSPLKGMKLQRLGAMNLAVSDLTPLQGMPLTALDLYGTRDVTNIKPLEGMPLDYLNLSSLQVSELSALKGMTSLRELILDGVPLTDATALRSLKLKKLNIDYRDHHEEVLRSLKGLESLNNKSFAQFWKDVDASAKDPDRRAAEYVLSIGGVVKVNEQDQEIKAAGELPRDVFRLTFVTLRGNKQVADAGLVAFKDCKNLTHLDLMETPVSDAGMVHFKQCKNLTLLFVSFTMVGDDGVAHFKDCKALSELELRFSQMSDAGLAHFKDCKNLSYINLTSTNITDAGLAHLKDCKSLKSIALDATGVTDAGLAHLKNCKDLTELQLPNLPISDEGLANLKDCKNLAVVNLKETNVGDASLEQLKGCKDLTSLQVQKTKVTAAGIDKLKKVLPACKIEWDGGVIEPQ